MKKPARKAPAIKAAAKVPATPAPKPGHPGHVAHPKAHHPKAVHPAAHPKAKAAGTKSAPARAKAKRAKAHKRRQLAGPLDYDGCVAEALGCGHALFAAAGGRDDGGVCIEAVLDAMGASGLIRAYDPADLDDPSALILGLSLPAPHAVLATPGGWWSWGELWPVWAFGDAVIEEAWTVEWEVPDFSL